MFITEEQARERLSSPDNLANSFTRRKENIDAEKCESGPPTSEATKTPSWPEIEEPESIESLSTETVGESEHRSDGITLKQPKRAGGRGPGLSKQERTEITIAASTSGLFGEAKETQREIAARHGISQIAVAKIKAGEGARDEVAVERALEEARSRAVDRLMASLGLLTDEKISGLDARGISQVAANMARVVEKTTPQAVNQNTISIIVAPQIRNEDSFPRTIIE
jgi:transcriptional regulator with XRE-family HTH domain